MLITTEEAHFTYSTKPATCNLDHFMHTIKTKAENLKVVLAESPKYVGLRDEAPRYMGDGFVQDLNDFFFTFFPLKVCGTGE